MPMFCRNFYDYSYGCIMYIIMSCVVCMIHVHHSEELSQLLIGVVYKTLELQYSLHSADQQELTRL